MTLDFDSLMFPADLSVAGETRFPHQHEWPGHRKKQSRLEHQQYFLFGSTELTSSLEISRQDATQQNGPFLTNVFDGSEK